MNTKPEKQCVNKRPYPSEIEAMGGMYANHGNDADDIFNVYHCQHCKQFHVGHKPKS